jgi:hypothetical protein
VDEQRYNRYMHFESLEANPWREEYLSSLLVSIAAVDTSVSAADMQCIWFCYSQEPNFRSYHGPDHGAFLGQPDAPEALTDLLSDKMPEKRAKSLLAIAGLFHDVAYKHVDEIDEQGTRAWTRVLRARIGHVAEYTRAVEDGRTVFRTHITSVGQGDAITQLVAHIFGVEENGIIHSQGGNEFDSALAAAKFLEQKGAPPESIVAAVTLIAATIPFRPAVGCDSQGNSTDGCMGALAERLRAAQLRIGGVVYQPDWQDVNDVMYLAVHLANRDVAQLLALDTFSGVIHGGRMIKKEEIPELRKGVTNIQELVRAAGLERSAPFLYQGLEGGNVPIPPDNVPHVYIPRDNAGNLLGVETAYPPVDVYRAAVETIKRNARLSRDFFRAHETGIALIASIATLIDEPEAPVPGIVDAILWHEKAIPRGNKRAQLSNDEQILYDELMYGKGQRDIDDTASRRSPTSGLILGAVGNAGIATLSSCISALRAEAKERGIADPFAQRELAERYATAVKDIIGPENFKTIVTEMHRVAQYYQDHPIRGNPDRPARLEALCPGLHEYSSNSAAV